MNFDSCPNLAILETKRAKNTNDVYIGNVPADEISMLLYEDTTKELQLWNVLPDPFPTSDLNCNLNLLDI